MEEKFYDEFEKYKNLGLKKKAKKTLDQFISSFLSFDEKKKWAESVISRFIKEDCKIRHELFEQIIFPVLYEGYKEKEFEATFRLSQLTQNMYQSKKAQELLGDITAEQLLIQCSKIDPSNEVVRKKRLHLGLNWLDFSVHEWPSGILYGMNGATLAQCEEIEYSLAELIELDKANEYEEEFASYREKLDEYKKRISRG